ncbi:MAG: glycosyltransferase [Nitrospira sp.]|nr:glycosyltransferase [Nitrospira sp.]
MKEYPRVAFFPDSHDEVNGVAHTSRQLKAFAQRRGLPFLCVHAGEVTRSFQGDPITTLELRRGPVKFGLDRDLSFDLLLWRYTQLAIQAVREFQADLIHITGPGDVGQLGAYIAYSLGIPLVASWHTNLHHYAAWRLEKLLSFLPEAWLTSISSHVEHQVLRAVLRFYKMARMLMAPNEELVKLLEQRTGKPSYLMRRGVDMELFSPAKRDLQDGVFRLGFVGRLTPEKNVCFLAEVERTLQVAGKTHFRFLIVGDGSERPWLEHHLKQADFTGVLKGEDLARAYANMDLFVFPSHTDAFGNVVLEALASGIPAVVTSQGGPKFLVQSGISGYVAADDHDFLGAVVALMSNPKLHKPRNSLMK